MQYLVAKSLSIQSERLRRSLKSEPNKIAEPFSHFRDSLRVISDFGSESGLGYNSIPHDGLIGHNRPSLGSDRGIFLARGAALGARDHCGRGRASLYRSCCNRSFLFSARDARPDAALLRLVLHSIRRQAVGSSLLLPLSLQ